MNSSAPTASGLALDRFFVKLPYSRLIKGALALFTQRGMRPEICFDAAQAEQLEPSDLRPVAKALAKHELPCTVHAPFLGLDFGSRDARTGSRARTALERTMRLCEILRPVCVVVHGGQPEYMTDAQYAAWNERALPLMDWTARAALDQGTRIMLENICHERPGQLAPLIEALDGKAGWCLDAGHMHVFGRTAPEDWVRRLGARLGQMHLHDNDGSADQHKSVGQGRIDFARLFDALLRSHPDTPRPVATLEVNFERDVESSLKTLGPVWPWHGE
jgi:sugar phosphate isomerase/epimerase